jgi:hypothetical protein
MKPSLVLVRERAVTTSKYESNVEQILDIRRVACFAGAAGVSLLYQGADGANVVRFLDAIAASVAGPFCFVGSTGRRRGDDNARHGGRIAGEFATVGWDECGTTATGRSGTGARDL